MKNIIWPPSLYNFLSIINNSHLKKRILDCGAGGKQPPLALFQQYGYETCGIDISESEIADADAFCKKHGINLNIQKGDLRKMPFDDESFSFVYSWHTVAHLSKKDTGIAINEMHRVLMKEGYCFVNFLSNGHYLFGEGKEVSNGEFLNKYGDEEVLHSFYEDDETDAYFKEIIVPYKEKRIIRRLSKSGEEVYLAYLEYITKKTLL